MSRPYVTVVVVAHDGGRWLGETLRALVSQSRRPDRVIGVDNGSRDGSADLLAQALGRGNVISLPRSTAFAESVADALGRLPSAGPDEWVWLLHDDCAPDRWALEALLGAVAHDPKAAVVGPKLRDWLDRRRLLEAGVTVGRTGRRDTGLEPHEFDQGQHDGVREVMSVSTAGMLVRRDVWEAVGGLDPFLPLFRDDLDLCWRVRNAGHKVLVATAAVAWHAEAAARRRRRITVSGDHPRRLDRRNAIFVVMANLPFRAMLWALLRNVLGSFFRALLFVLGKQPANALDELVAMGSVLVHPLRLARARRARRHGRKRGYIRIKRLMTPPGAAYRRLADMVQSFLAGETPVEAAGRHHHAPAATEDDDEHALVPADSGAVKRFLSRPGVVLMLALAAVSLVAERSLLFGDRLGGGALVPVSGSAGELWAFYTEGFHDGVGLGSDAWAPPYVAVVAALSTLALGKTWLAVTVLLLGSVPLAGATAYLATRHVIPAVPARAWAAGTYALLPVATGAIAAGRLGTAVVFVLVPVYASLATSVLSAEPRRARRAAWALGLLLAVGTAFVPLTYPMVALLAGAALAVWRRPGVVTSVAVALLVPVALLFPWLATLVAAPGRLLLEAGLHDPALADASLAPEALLTLSPGGPGLPPFWVTAGLLATALAALLMRRQRMIVALGWGVALYGVLTAILVSRIPVGGTRGWPGVPLAFAGTGLVVLVALTAHRLAGLRAGGGLRRLGATAAVALAFSTPLLAAGWWVYTGVRGPLTGDAPDVLPALAAARSTHGERTLVVRGAAFTVLHRRTPLLGEAELPVPAEAAARVTAAAQGLVGGRGGDAATLAQHGIAMIAVAPPVSARLARTLDSQPSLERLSLSESGGLWRLAEPVTRVPAQPESVLHKPWLWAQGAMVLVMLVLAAPGRRESPQDAPAEPAPAAPLLAARAS
ncbi:glycosyltransferase family 2 protein [Actinomadura sp. ATCC 31491]|uniref:Glycosyltransferase family 2 protein n=1 Tax=Actinomadura luzonensis TaxID=2805427 RepID=A0ABT0G9B3_9ACTN|nr:glycosyltransferase family 2 protein [Actinomadura luzonensis]MCK2221195.1 glycosyltransferase family 2 protein [Actinomadura luzonensis]